jgi:hypothetical protein
MFRLATAVLLCLMFPLSVYAEAGGSLFQAGKMIAMNMCKKDMVEPAVAQAQQQAAQQARDQLIPQCMANKDRAVEEAQQQAAQQCQVQIAALPQSAAIKPGDYPWIALAALLGAVAGFALGSRRRAPAMG